MELDIAIRLVFVECAACSMPFGMSEKFRNERLADHATFYCPSGHRNYYGGKSKTEKLQEELDRSTAREKSLSSVIDRQRETIKGRDHIIRGQKAAKTRLKNRIAAGVCPCCNRTFQNLASHMKGQHPEFVTT